MPFRAVTTVNSDSSVSHQGSPSWISPGESALIFSGLVCRASSNRSFLTQKAPAFALGLLHDVPRMAKFLDSFNEISI